MLPVCLYWTSGLVVCGGDVLELQSSTTFPTICLVDNGLLAARVQLLRSSSWLRVLGEPVQGTLPLPGNLGGSSLLLCGDITLSDREGLSSPSCSPVNSSPVSPPTVRASAAVATSG